MYEEGHAQTIRQGVGEWEGYLVADLHIHSRSLIQAVQGGKGKFPVDMSVSMSATETAPIPKKHQR